MDLVRFLSSSATGSGHTTTMITTSCQSFLSFRNAINLCVISYISQEERKLRGGMGVVYVGWVPWTQRDGSVFDLTAVSSWDVQVTMFIKDNTRTLPDRENRCVSLP